MIWIIYGCRSYGAVCSIMRLNESKIKRFTHLFLNQYLSKESLCLPEEEQAFYMFLCSYFFWNSGFALGGHWIVSSAQVWMSGKFFNTCYAPWIKLLYVRLNKGRENPKLFIRKHPFVLSDYPFFTMKIVTSDNYTCR